LNSPSALYITKCSGALPTPRPRLDLPGATILEYASYTSTRDLERAMINAGMTHQVVHYQYGGVHAWEYYGDQLKAGWDAVYKSQVS